MKYIYSQITEKISKISRNTAISAFLAVSLFLSFIPFDACFGYVTPDYEAQARANEMQKVENTQTFVNYAKQERDNERQVPYRRPTIDTKKQLKDNKKQAVDHRTRVNKKNQKKHNKRQETKVKPYKYDKQAEKHRNDPQVFD